MARNTGASTTVAQEERRENSLQHNRGSLNQPQPPARGQIKEQRTVADKYGVKYFKVRIKLDTFDSAKRQASSNWYELGYPIDFIIEGPGEYRL